MLAVVREKYWFCDSADDNRTLCSYLKWIKTWTNCQLAAAMAIIRLTSWAVMVLRTNKKPIKPVHKTYIIMEPIMNNTLGSNLLLCVDNDDTSWHIHRCCRITTERPTGWTEIGCQMITRWSWYRGTDNTHVDYIIKQNNGGNNAYHHHWRKMKTRRALRFS